MEKEIMCASILTAIILCIVGIIKVFPCSLYFKEKHPKWYKGIFYGISLILAVVLPIISELYILKGTLASMNFFVLIITTIAGVFGLYGTYEGTQLKELVSKLISSIKTLFEKFSENKLAKVVEKVGLDKLTQIDTMNKENEAKKAAELEAKKVEKENKLKAKEAKKLEKAQKIVAQSGIVVETSSSISNPIVETTENQQTTQVVNSTNPTNN